MSDAYVMDSSLTDLKFSYKLYAVINPPSGNTLPSFATPLQQLQIEAERAYSYTLPEIVDPEIPDQFMTVKLENDSGIEWLLLSEDQKRVYTEAGLSTAMKMGNYVFNVVLNDGY